MATLQNIPVRNNPCKFPILLKAAYICPGLKFFCFSKLKLTTASWDKLSLWTSFIVHAHDNVKGNYVLSIDDDLQEFPTKMCVSSLLTGA